MFHPCLEAFASAQCATRPLCPLGAFGMASCRKEPFNISIVIVVSFFHARYSQTPNSSTVHVDVRHFIELLGDSHVALQAEENGSLEPPARNKAGKTKAAPSIASVSRGDS